MKIQKLPAATRSKLQSGIIVTDAVQCVLELVHNSLDAEATGIAVRVDLKSYQIRVIDNGRGIAKDDLELVGKRFMTSKHQHSLGSEASFSTYGYKGQALSSLLEVSRSLIIETKSDKNGPIYKKVFRNNRALPVFEIDNEKPGTGTTVIVEDFLYTMPVRRKRINEVFDLEEIKNQLQYLAIIHYNVCFTLRNENKGIILLQTPQASSILESLRNIYGKSLAKSLKALYCNEKNYEVNGFISLKPHIQSNVQLLYLNKRIITKGVIHKFINNLTKEYNGKKALHSSSPIGQIMKNLKGSTHNVFIIQIQCPCSYYELFTNLRKTTVEFRNWKDLLKCIHKAIKRTFKADANSDSLSSSQLNKECEAPKDKEGKKTFGTSLLLNAVKGAPAKRSLPLKRNAKRRKKIKLNDVTENSEVSLPKIKNKATKKLLFDTLSTITEEKENVNDSLESPIPKSKLKMLCNSKNKAGSINHSFVEFYEWLKAKLDTDTNIFNFYNDFLKSKKTSGSERENFVEFKSPILGGKPKLKKVAKTKKKNLLGNKTKLLDKFSVLDDTMAFITEKELKALPEVQLKVQEAAQFSDVNNKNSVNVNLSYVSGGNLNFLDHSSQSVFKKPESVIKSNQNRPREEESPFLPSSEMQFTNVIKFRNLPDSFFKQPSEALDKIPVEQTLGFTISNSWESHYQDFVCKNVEFLEKSRNGRNYFSRPKIREYKMSERNDQLYFDFSKFFETRSLEINNKAKRFRKLQSVEIQVNMSEMLAQKVDAMVQTNHEDSKSPGYDSSYVFKQANFISTEKEAEYNFRKSRSKCMEDNISLEVPNPDFWNTTAHLELENKISANVASDTSATAVKNPTNDITGKNSPLSEFICGHKSRSSTKTQNERNTSKETQTIAAIWTDSLTELGHASEKANLNTGSNFNSVDTNSATTKTIPIQEIENLIDQPESFNFCLTERHDCMPKGLSPSFLFPEAAKILNLSSLEKCKIKLTIDDTQNELLANIKWQEDSTGDCLKPTIPDRILFEMHRKAGESGVNYENPILSASMSYCAVKVHNLLHSFAFTKELLSEVEILGQLDKKFIVTKIQIASPKKMELISLFDQHAVDERIKLEELMNENFSADGKLVSSCLNPPVECVLSDSDVRVVSDLLEKISNFGLSIKIVNESTIFVHEIPTFLLNKHDKDLKNKKESTLSDAIKALIINILHEITETRGGLSKIPKIIFNAFCLEACHKAIKFNKALTVENMSEMIQKLRNCKLPFQCAHGRPSVIPIIDLEDFNSMMGENESVDFQELTNFFNKRKCDTVSNDAE